MWLICIGLYIHVKKVEISQNRHFNCFQIIFLPEIGNVERWITITNLAIHEIKSTQMPIFKKSQQNSGIDNACIFLIQIAAVSSSLAHANELEQKHAQQDLYGAILGKFH